MIKRKKFAGTQGALPVIAEIQEVEGDAFLNNIVKTVTGYGFHQILPPPTEDRRTFAKHPELAKRFGQRMIDAGGQASAETVLAPTQIFNIFKKYLQNVKRRGPHVTKWFYISPVMFLKDNKPVTEHEVGLFVLGEDTALSNSHLINALVEILRELEIPDFMIELNSLGCKNCQKEFAEVLAEHLAKNSFDLCADCKADLAAHPLYVLSCQNGNCHEQLSGAPQIVDFLDES